jgi:predicted TIM-barrel fold metal-dependent hydrolase
MRIVTLEEHVSFPEMGKHLPADILKDKKTSNAAMQMMPKLEDVTGERLSSMNETGIAMQVLSVENTDVNLLTGNSAADFASKYNDLLAEKIKDHPQRFTAFAHLPMTAPAAAADELERTVKTYGFPGAMIKGLTNGEFLDAPNLPRFLKEPKSWVCLFISIPAFRHKEL